jgi:undecaprenyl diphosphate synthase
MESLTTKDVLVPYHLGIIMDGNGRWAQKCGLPRTAGHQAGIQAARRIIEVCVDFGIQVLTLYVFSTENWRRSREEVDFLMRLAEEYATHELPELQRNGIRLQLMGKREDLPNSFVNALDRAIFQTRDNSRMILNLAVNYGGRTEIIDAIKAILTAHGQGTIDGSKLDESIIARYLYCPDCPDVDMVIRTSGECRLSNFLIWRAAHAVLWSTPVLWPDFQQEQFQEAIRIYGKVHSRQYIGS